MSGETNLCRCLVYLHNTALPLYSLSVIDNTGNCRATRYLRCNHYCVSFPAADKPQVNFGDVAAGGSSNTQTITLTNNGFPATLAEVSISPGGQFTVTGGTCEALSAPLLPFGTCTFTVKAIPTVTGTVSAVLAVSGRSLTGTFNAPLATLTANGGVIPVLKCKYRLVVQPNLPCR